MGFKFLKKESAGRRKNQKCQIELKNANTQMNQNGKIQLEEHDIVLNWELQQLYKQLQKFQYKEMVLDKNVWKGIKKFPTQESRIQADTSIYYFHNVIKDFKCHVAK